MSLLTWDTTPSLWVPMPFPRPGFRALSRQIDYVAISITNPYHLVSTRNMIESIRQLNQNVQIIVGGHAIQKLGEKVALLRADFIMSDFESLKRLEGEQL